MMKWMRRITSKPIVDVDLGWSQEDLDAYLFDPSARGSWVNDYLTTPSLNEPAPVNYYWRKDGS